MELALTYKCVIRSRVRFLLLHVQPAPVKRRNQDLSPRATKCVVTYASPHRVVSSYFVAVPLSFAWLLLLLHCCKLLDWNNWYICAENVFIKRFLKKRCRKDFKFHVCIWKSQEDIFIDNLWLFIFDVTGIDFLIVYVCLKLLWKYFWKTYEAPVFVLNVKKSW